MVLGPARAWSRVVVDGAGRLARDVTDDLRAAGVGEVTGGLYALDAELRLTRGSPDLVVLVSGHRLPSGTAAPLMAHGIPHLPVQAGELDVVVGPLVLPGRSACLTCLDLVRATRHSHGARRASAAADVPFAHPAPAVVDPALRALARATTTMTVCAALSDQCPPGVSLELAMPWPRPVQRVWEPHPRCPCGAPDAGRRHLRREWTA